MSQRNRRRSAAAIATTLLAAAFSLLPMTGASAATGFNACPRGYVCGWSGTEGTGQLYKTKSSEPALGAWSDRVAKLLRSAQTAGEIAADRDADVLGRFLVNAWEGAVTRTKVNKSGEAMDDFFAVVFDQLLR